MKLVNKVSLSDMSILLAASLALTACSSSNNNEGIRRERFRLSRRISLFKWAVTAGMISL
ncbi:hypothetical protein RAC89_25495 [Paenibacillus sp. GD4]|uniref:hypothetical protein n=1 Tax=Paenibacillus sp. GD4 TaxID=3068890 RepID=UPI002796D3C5|nr:hypothetical protein [Paenibacillus sp. GD4]MDQ1913761.1 hypothetical protein [Paenibacillus sp. GD4]